MGSQGKRREYYGMPGLFRPKKYGLIGGVEYRTPSNLWLADKESIEAMMTNALSLERVLREEPVDDIMTCITTLWPDLVAADTFVNEDAGRASTVLATVQDMFPKYEWKVGV